MILADLLGPGRIVVPLDAATVPEAAQVLAEACIRDGRVAHPARLRAVLAQIHAEDSVSLGDRAHLPHVRTDAVPSLVAALGVAPRPIPGPVRDGPAARVVLLVLAPPTEAVSYLQAVAAFVRVLARREAVAALEAARTPQDVMVSDVLRERIGSGQLLVRDVMTAQAVAVGPDASLDEAATLLLRHGITAVPVVNPAAEVIGLISHRELLRHLIQPMLAAPGGEGGGSGPGRDLPRERAAPTVGAVMSRTVLCLNEEQALSDVARLMVDKDIDRLPVVRQGLLTGFLTRADIVRRVLGNEGRRG